LKKNNIYIIYISIYLLFVLLNCLYGYIILGDIDVYTTSRAWAQSDEFSQGDKIGNYYFRNIALTDSFIYKELFNDISSFVLFLQDGQRAYSILGISLISYLIEDVISHFLLNMILCLILGYYLIKINLILGNKNLVPVLFIYFYPYTFFYCQTINKEIFLATFFIVFIHSLMVNNKKMLALSLLGILIIKVYILFVAISCIVFHYSKMNPTKKIQYLKLFIFIYLLLLPGFSQITSRADMIFELDGNENSLVEKLSNLLNKIPLSGYIIFPIKFIMHMAEGLIGTTFIREKIYFDLWGIIGFISALYCFILLCKYFIIFCSHLFFSKYEVLNPNLQLIQVAAFFSSLFLLSNSFIHIRYFYFILPLLFIIVSKEHCFFLNRNLLNFPLKIIEKNKILLFYSFSLLVLIFHLIK
jgi:hypothetical protein